MMAEANPNTLAFSLVPLDLSIYLTEHSNWTNQEARNIVTNLVSLLDAKDPDCREDRCSIDTYVNRLHSIIDHRPRAFDMLDQETARKAEAWSGQVAESGEL